jgi:hypothetical protein
MKRTGISLSACYDAFVFSIHCVAFFQNSFSYKTVLPVLSIFNIHASEYFQEKKFSSKKKKVD